MEVHLSRFMIIIVSLTIIGCTSKYQVRGIEETTVNTFTVQEVEAHECVQKTLDARSVENFERFNLGIIEFNDEGRGNPTQQQQVLDLVKSVTEEAQKNK